ncbi:MAG: MBL fold metallo-hydrolase [Flavobacteriaceae bacterium]|tara:strand:+ start:176 stop:1000 length:825 start_codon:yes stop_codon:yes gene_type:complete
MKYLFLLFLFLCSDLKGQEKFTLKQEIDQHKKGVGLWWTGHNGWIIKSNDLVISTDILLNYDKRINKPPISEKELAQILDISFITHYHKDHFARSISKVLIEESDCIFVIPESCLEVAKELKIPPERIRIAIPRKKFTISGVNVTPIRAIHGNADFAIYYKANLQDCGYVIEVDGKRFLQPGDSFLLEDHLFLEDIDVLFFSPTEHNMHINNSLTLINRLEPKYILPQHHSTVIVNSNTFFWAKGYQKEVKEKLSKKLKDRYYILKEGDKLLIH